MHSSSILSKLLARADGACKLLLSRGMQQASNPKMTAKLAFPWSRHSFSLKTETSSVSNSVFEISSLFTFDAPWQQIETESGSFLSKHEIWMVRNGYHDLDVLQLPQKTQVAILESIIEAKMPGDTVFVHLLGHDSLASKKIEFIPAVTSVEELQMHLDLEGS